MSTPYPAPRRPDLSGALLFTGGLLGTLLVWLLASGVAGRREAQSRTDLARLRGDRSRASLRRAIVGQPKRSVAMAFGEPRAAMVAGAADGKSGFWGADTWYYLLDARDRSAMAVQFENGVARTVEFIQGPG